MPSPQAAVDLLGIAQDRAAGGVTSFEMMARSGIDAVNDILSSHSVPVIFITAFPERLLTGERPEPTFLVTKPFNPDMVKALISQALFFNEGSRVAA